MHLPKVPRYTRYEKLITFVVLGLLVVHTFYPKLVNVDKYSMAMLGILVLIAVMPSISSAKLPYLLEIKKKVTEPKKEKKEVKAK